MEAHWEKVAWTRFHSMQGELDPNLFFPLFFCLGDSWTPASFPRAGVHLLAQF